jgi:PAS domain S-box-containing protein
MPPSPADSAVTPEAAFNTHPTEASLQPSGPVVVVAMAVAYLLAAELGHALTLGSQSLFATFWPASGLYLAVLLSLPRRVWPWVVLGAAIGNLGSDVLLQGRDALVVAGFILANASEALVAAFLLSRFRPPGAWRLENTRDGLALAAFGVVVGPAVGALIGGATVSLAYGVAVSTTWPLWWAADLVGVVLVTPVLLALARVALLHRGHWRTAVNAYLTRRPAELVSLWLLVGLTAALVITDPVGVPVLYLLLPSLLWASMRFGLGGSASVNVLVGLLVTGVTRMEIGPFAVLPLAEQALVLQTLLAAYAGTGLLVALLFLERRQAESTLEARVQERTRALSSSEERYRTIVEMSNDAIFIILDERIAYCNEAFVRLIGARERAQVVGMDPERLIPVEQRESVRKWALDVLAAGAPRAPVVERRLVRLDGAVVEVESSVAVYDASGTRGLQVLVRDITERKRVERAMWKNRERMKLALRAARMYVFENDLVAGTVIRSSEAADVVGLPTNSNSPIGDFGARVHPEDRERYNRRLHSLSGPDDTHWCKYRFVHPLGHELELEEFGQGAFDEQGRLVAVIGVVVDVTDREATLAQLRVSEERFATLAGAVPAILMTARDDGACDYANPAFSTFTGMTAAEAMGDGWFGAIEAQDHRRVRRQWRTALREGEPFSAEFRLRGADGSTRWFKAVTVPVRDPQQAVSQWISVALDVEDQKRIESELQAADRRKDEYLAMLAHELRNPLAPIRNATALLLRKIAPADPVRPAAEMIERQGRHLSRLVDELLDVSRVTRGKIRLDVQTVDLATAVRNGVEAALPSMDRRRQGLELRLPPPGTFLQVDLVRFAQVIANLLDNASKFSPEGVPVCMEASLDGDWVVIRVTDQGDGIAPELLPGVFDLFTQAQGTLDRSTGGLGIGLALVKALVEQHGGTVEAASDGLGRGATFTVRLPLRLPASLLESANGAQATGAQTTVPAL